MLEQFLKKEDFDPFLSQLISRAGSGKESFSLALITLDRFKKLNERFGHVFGDEIIKYADSTLRLTFQEALPDLFRYGEDSFIVVVPEAQPKEILRLVKQCNYNMLGRPFLFKNRLFRTAFTCGIAGFPRDGNTSKELIKKINEAKYLSRRDGRGFVILASRIKYIKSLNLILLAFSILIILSSLFIMYERNFKEVSQRAINNIKNSALSSRITNIKITIKPKLDMIILKNGAIIEGHIVQETEDKVILNLGLEKGQGSTIFEKSEILKIEYH
ncbi:MAG: GGDEF domain-containing protein [Candidatus Omnitrophota bacterium]